MATSSAVPKVDIVVNVWFDIEWRPKGSESSWRRAFKQLSEPDAREQMKKWSMDYDCQLVKLTQTMEVIP